jgi:hypothetical protein
MNELGDTKVQWNPSNEDEIEVAEEMFDKLIDKGHLAYTVKKDGSKGKMIKKFKPSAGMIIMVPPVKGG